MAKNYKTSRKIVILQLGKFQLHTTLHKIPLYWEMLLLRAEQSNDKNVFSKLYLDFLIWPFN